MKVLFSFAFLLSSFAFAQSDTLSVTSLGLHPGSRVNAVPYVQEALKACEGKPGTIIYFPKGRYDFWPHGCVEKVYYESNTTLRNPRRCAIVIESLKGITMDGGGSEFIFHDRMQPFSVDKSEDILIKNVAVDWEIPFGADVKL